MSRRTRLKDEPGLTAEFVKRLRAGDSVADTCTRLEVPLSTYKDWMRWGSIVKGEQIVAKEPFRTFAREVGAALADFKGRLLDELGRQARDARYASDVPNLGNPEGPPLHRKGDIILAPSGYVARPGSVHALTWLLERRFPKEFAPQVRVIVEEQLNAALRALERGLPPEMYALALELIAHADEGSAEASGPAGSEPGGAGAPPTGGSSSSGSGSEGTRH